METKFEKENFFSQFNQRVLVCDGATGTNLLQRGLPPGIPAEQWLIDKPQEIKKLHQDFIEAGADIILTCSFGASPLRLKQHGLDKIAEKINHTAVQTAKSVTLKNTLVAGSIGPLGEMLTPYGTLNESDAIFNYSSQAKWLSDAGVDMLVIETQFDIHEAKIAVESALSVTDKPIICSFSYDRGTRTMMGVSPKIMATEFNESGIAAVGINCGKSLDENLTTLLELRKSTNLPIWFKPNAGLPQTDKQGLPYYDLTPEQMGESSAKWVQAGANIVGGCCGTSPEHLRNITAKLKYF